MKKMKPYCLWFTGMPNSGKSTLVYHLLQKKLRNCIVIDGDKFRERVNPELSFSRKDIIENNKTAIKMIKFLMGEGFNVLVAMITPFQEIRDMARKKIDNYFEIWVDCPEEIRKKRPNFIKSDIIYEIPISSDLAISTYASTIKESIEQILCRLKNEKII